MEELIKYQRFTNRKWLTIILCVLGGELGWVHWYNGNSNQAWRNWLLAVIGGVFTCGLIPAIMWMYIMGTTFWRILDAQSLEDLYAVSDVTPGKKVKAQSTEINSGFIAGILIIASLIIAIVIFSALAR